MKPWPFVVVLVGLVLGGTVYILVREPESGASTRSGRELPRLPLDRVAAPLPPRFAGPLPSRVEGFHHELEQGPPLSYVRARLLEGDQEMGTKFLSALRQAAASARSLDELWGTHGVVLGLGDHGDDKPPDDMNFLKGLHDEGVPCAWLRERLADTAREPPLLTELLWRKLVRCPGSETTALFAREDAPITWVLAHHSLFDSPRFTPALESAVRRILNQSREELFVTAMYRLSRKQEPVAQGLREELWRRASGEIRAEWERREAMRDEFARQWEEEQAWKCPPIPNPPGRVDALTVGRCLEKWVASSWTATARFAMSASRSPELQGASEPLATVRNFSSLAEMKAWAREWKLVPAATPTMEDEPRSLSLSSIMRQAQRAFVINLETRDFPRRHDELLVTLAWKVRPALAGVVFEQLPPKTLPADFFQPPSSDEYTLRAYADGQRFSVKARNSHSLEDIGAVVGLLNQVLESRGGPHRFAVLDSQVSEVQVVFGPEAALREADARGLWRLGDGREVLVQAEARIEKNLRRLLGEVPF
ncbi:hypothetical protein [Archangium violaceum]|uniref:Uncharacterized protein n=1 Tax=Archangium violaceum Cb vi76 TaxID=1406225 RepID=A0A084SMS5_9BACT|nr:hypothetical protein [Archangium violaceum]KFA89760.1 hypothetical protein Q664_33310 [Archangium violaceum Cb vi76]